MSALIDYHQLRPNDIKSPSREAERKRKLSTTLMTNSSTLKVDESASESMRVHESFRPNESPGFTYRVVPNPLGVMSVSFDVTDSRVCGVPNNVVKLDAKRVKSHEHVSNV